MWKRVTGDPWLRMSANSNLFYHGTKGILSHLDKVPFYLNQDHVIIQESSEGATEVSMEVKNLLSAALTAIILLGSRNVL